MMEIGRPGPPSLPPMLLRFEDIKLSCPHPARPPRPGAANAAGNIPPASHTGRLASFHLPEEKEGGGTRLRIRKQVEEQVLHGKRALPGGIPTSHPHEVKDPGGGRVHLREGRQFQQQNMVFFCCTV